jgi:Short C-terminal domain
VGLLKSLKGMAGGVNQELLQTGILGRALCTSIRDTGTRVNNAIVIEFALTVDLPDRDPYEVKHKQRVQQIMLAQISPGAVYAVRVNPHDPNDLAISWNEAPPEAETVSAAEIAKTGKPGQAQIMQFEATGRTAPSGDPILTIALNVTPGDGGAAYQVVNMYRVPTALQPRITQGATVPVKIGNAASLVVIDWDGIEPGSAEAPGPAQTTAVNGGDASIADLERLAKLHESGALSDTEFESQKAKILARM